MVCIAYSHSLNVLGQLPSGAISLIVGRSLRPSHGSRGEKTCLQGAGVGQVRFSTSRIGEFRGGGAVSGTPSENLTVFSEILVQTPLERQLFLEG